MISISPYSLEDKSSTTSKVISAQSSLESTSGNQILLATDEITTTPKMLTSPTIPVISTRPRTSVFIPDDAHV
jgi:hypothetical protein